MADETYTKADLDAAVKAAIEKETEGLKSKIEELIGDNKKLKADLRKTQDIKPEDVAAIEKERDDLAEKLKAAEKAAKEATSAAEKAAKALEAEQGVTHRLLVQDGLKSALIANGVKDEDFIDTLTAKFAGQAKVVSEGDERKVMLGDKALADAIKEFAGSESGKKFVAAPANGGGGAPGGGAKGDVRTMTRAQYDALDVAAKTDAGKQAAKGELKITDAAA